MIFGKRIKKDNDLDLGQVISRLSEFESELKSTQNAIANLKKDFRKIIHDEILAVLDYRARRTTPL